MYAYNFEGRRYAVGNKIGYLQATVEYTIRKSDFKDEFIKYFIGKLKWTNISIGIFSAISFIILIVYTFILPIFPNSENSMNFIKTLF